MNPATATPARVRALIDDARRMFPRSPLTDDAIEQLARACANPPALLPGMLPATTTDASATGSVCLRCGRDVLEPRQLCPDRTPASPFCWAADLRTGELEIQPGLRLRPGDNYPPLKIVKDPYQQAGPT